MSCLIYNLRGKYEDALDLTQQAHNINVHEPIINYFLGNLLALTKNDHMIAQEYYRRTLAIDPTHIYARRQLRLSYCYTMHQTWELLGCTNNKENCDEKSIRTLSIRCNLLLSHQSYRIYDATMASATSRTHCHEGNTKCM
jgi:tetratricopeptide (TPR) repeat protein